MKKVFALIGCASMLFAFGCTKEKFSGDEPVSKGSTKITLTADFTKTTIGGLSEGVRYIYWAKGDQVNVNGEVSDALPDDLPAETRSVTFTFTDKMLTPPFKAVYPAAIWKDASTVTIPASVPMGVVPLSAYGDMSSLPVKPLSAILKLTVKKAAENPDADKVVKVILSSEDTRLSGDFAIDYENGVLTPAANPTDAEKTISLDKTFYPTDEGYDLFIPVPAGTYGLKLKLVDNQGHFMEVPTSAPKTFVAGQVKALTAFEFKPTGTQIDIVINSPADLTKLATDWNTGAFDKDFEPIVHLASDLIFDATSSAAFSATGGIGTEKLNGSSNYFNGLFEGNMHNISGYTGSVPFFAYTGSGGIIQNLHFMDDCVVTVESPAAGSMHGVVVGRHKGMLRGVSVDGNLVINNIQDVTTGNQFYGGLVGRSYGGSIVDCCMLGDVICDQTQTITANAAYIGGITGYLTDGGKVTSSTFDGNIIISDGDEYGGIVALSKYFYIGGIVGYSNKGEIKTCFASNPSTPGKIDARGQFIPAIGGITGWATEDVSITDTDNSLQVSFKSDGARAQTTQARVAGIAARSMGTIENCNNYGPVSTVCQSTTLWLGGIAGDASGLIKNCTNTESALVTRTNQLDGGQSNRYVAIGGIVGGALAALTIEGCDNYAAILGNAPTTSTSATIDIGGILGYAQKFSVTVKDCKNSATVKLSDTVNRTAYARVSVGGVAGCINGANSKVISCENSGLAHSETSLGGESSGGINDRRTYVGGIVGIMANHATGGSTGLAGLEIASCTNTGQVWSQNYNNRATLAGAPFGGGIVGVIIGTEESPASVHDCISNSAKALTNYRGFIGGVAGYAGNSEIKDNAVSGEISGNKSATGNGGIVSWAVASTLKGCTFGGTLKTVKNIGGLVYNLDAGSSIDACKVDGATITKGTDSAATEAAVLVSNAASGTVVKDCGIKGTLNGAAIDLDSNLITTDGGVEISGTYLL